MSEFAAYQPAHPQDLEPLSDPLIEEARRGDLDEVARLSAAREGVGEAESRAAIERRLARSTSKPRLFVTRIDGVVAAFAWVAWLEAESVPTGWYLAGRVGSPALRRSRVDQNPLSRTSVATTRSNSRSAMLCASPLMWTTPLTT